MRAKELARLETRARLLFAAAWRSAAVRLASSSTTSSPRVVVRRLLARPSLARNVALLAQDLAEEVLHPLAAAAPSAQLSKRLADEVEQDLLETLEELLAGAASSKGDSFEHQDAWRSLAEVVAQARAAGEDALRAAAKAGRRARRSATVVVLRSTAQANKRAQRALGVQRYRWKTRGDSRVRRSHRRLDGRTFTWGQPPLVDGRRLDPGEDFACRCVAVPVLGGGE